MSRPSAPWQTIVLALVGTGCQGDGGLELRTNPAYAVGSVGMVGLGDSCRPLDDYPSTWVCEIDRIVEVRSVTVDPPIFTVVEARPGGIALRAEAEGDSVLVVAVKHEDGSIVELSKSIHARTPDRVKLGLRCPDEVLDPLRVITNDQIDLHVQLHAGDQLLAAHRELPIVASNLTVVSEAGSRAILQADANPTEGQIVSPFDPSLAFAVTVVDPASIDGIALHPTTLPVKVGRSGEVRVFASIAGAPVCQPPEATYRLVIETVDTCSFRSSSSHVETLASRERRYAATVFGGPATGTCRVRAVREPEGHAAMAELQIVE